MSEKKQQDSAPDPLRPYPDGIPWNEVLRQRQSADVAAEWKQCAYCGTEHIGFVLDREYQRGWKNGHDCGALEQQTTMKKVMRWLLAQYRQNCSDRDKMNTDSRDVLKRLKFMKR